MSRFPEEMKVIPWGAWVIAACIGLGFGLLLQLEAGTSRARFPFNPRVRGSIPRGPTQGPGVLAVWA